MRLGSLQLDDPKREREKENAKWTKNKSHFPIYGDVAHVMPTNAINFKFVAQKKKHNNIHIEICTLTHTQTYFHEINLFIPFFSFFHLFLVIFPTELSLLNYDGFVQFYLLSFFVCLWITEAAEVEVVWNVRGWYSSWLKFNQSNRIEGSHVFHLRAINIKIAHSKCSIYIPESIVCRTTSSPNIDNAIARCDRYACDLYFPFHEIENDKINFKMELLEFQRQQ